MASNKLNLNSTILNVSVNNIWPFCSIQRNEKNQIIGKYSIEIELLRLLGEYFNFQINLIDSHHIFGHLENGTWKGNIGSVVNQESHFGMCYLSITKDRLEYVDFSEYIFSDDRVFLTHAPRHIQPNLTSPFTGETWACILLSFTAILLLLSRRNFHWQSVALNLTAIFVNQSHSFSRKYFSTFTRVVLSIWLFCALVLSTAYSSNYYSMLTVPHSEAPLDTVTQLLQSISHYRVISFPKSIYLQAFLEAEASNAVYYRIGQFINRTSILTFHFDDVLPQLRTNPNYIFFTSSLYGESFGFFYPGNVVHVGAEGLQTDYSSIAFPKDSPLKEPFNSIIIRVREMGLIERWTKQTMLQFNKTMQKTYAEDSTLQGQNCAKFFTLKDLKSIFILWIYGIGLTIVCFIFEQMSLVFSRLFGRQ